MNILDVEAIEQFVWVQQSELLYEELTLIMINNALRFEAMSRKLFLLFPSLTFQSLNHGK